MNEFLTIMGGIIIAGIATTIYFFRRGGVYNPQEPEIAPDFTETPLITTITETMPTEPVLSEPQPTLEAVCTAMRDFEGGTNDANYRNNNPLNCKYYYGGYLPKYGKVGISPAGFAIFSSYAIGWMYSVNMIKNKIKNHPNWTLRDLISDHAPASDNNPVDVYTAYVAKRAGITKDFLVKNLT